MKEIKIKQQGTANTAMLVEYYRDGILIDFEILNDTKLVQGRISEFIFSNKFERVSCITD